MPSDPTNPVVILGYAVALLFSPPLLYALWKMALFFAEAIVKLKQIDAIATDVAALKRDKDGESRSVEMSLTIIETDINALQEKAGLPQRLFPDRRVGPADRRQA